MLGVLWRFKGKRDGFTLAGLRCVGELALADEAIAQYLEGLPAADYRMASQLDWVEPYLKKQLAEAERLAGTGTKEKQESILKVLSLFEARNTKTETNKNQAEVSPDLGATETEKVPQKTDGAESSECSKPYAIIEALQESEALNKDFDGAVQLMITKIACSYVES